MSYCSKGPRQTMAKMARAARKTVNGRNRSSVIEHTLANKSVDMWHAIFNTPEYDRLHPLAKTVIFISILINSEVYELEDLDQAFYSDVTMFGKASLMRFDPDDDAWENHYYMDDDEFSVTVIDLGDGHSACLYGLKKDVFVTGITGNAYPAVSLVKSHLPYELDLHRIELCQQFLMRCGDEAHKQHAFNFIQERSIPPKPLSYAPLRLL